MTKKLTSLLFGPLYCFYVLHPSYLNFELTYLYQVPTIMRVSLTVYLYRPIDNVQSRVVVRFEFT